MAPEPHKRPVRLPPNDLAARDLPQTREGARVWWKIHRPARDPTLFSLQSTHRYSHPNCPHPILYVGIDPATCLWEVFGDTLFDNGRVLPKTH